MRVVICGERWARIADAPAYAVSSSGSVFRIEPGRRTHVGKMMSPLSLKCGYLAVRPVVNGKNIQRYVHRLVAMAFAQAGGPVVNHIDGDKHNNSASNLEWVTHAENMAHAARSGLMLRGEGHPSCKLSDAAVADMRARWANGARNGALAAMFSVSRSTVSQLVHGKRRCEVAS